MTVEALKLAELIARTIVELATLSAIVYGVRLSFDYLRHRLDTTGKGVFERRPDNDPPTVQ